MARTRQTLAQADLRIQVVDVSRPPPENLKFEISNLKSPSGVELLALNKTDLGMDEGWRDAEFDAAVYVSCRTGEGLNDLSDAIFQRVTAGAVAWNDAAPAVNARHANCLRRAKEALTAGRALLAAGESPEFAAMDLRLALESVGEVVGGADTESILGEIFATFCIGK